MGVLVRSFVSVIGHASSQVEQIPIRNSSDLPLAARRPDATQVREIVAERLNLARARWAKSVVPHRRRTVRARLRRSN
jgi:hypothetical protein